MRQHIKDMEKFDEQDENYMFPGLNEEHTNIAKKILQ